MKNYGSKDLMRLESIRDKAPNDFMTQMMYAYNMSCAITEPGKALARGYAAQEVFGEYSPICAVFFERAYKLGGSSVVPSASENPWDDSDEGLEELYYEIPEKEQPASRKPNPMVLTGEVSRRTSWSALAYLGKLNLIKGSGPNFDLRRYPLGTIEVWETEDEKYRIIYTGNLEPNYLIGEERTFKYEGKEVVWKMIDYIESEFVSNLAPLYGKSLPIYSYD
jgi:hypothetical protein